MQPKPHHLVICSIFWLPSIWGHGRLFDPPSRSTMWRFGFDNPKNYNDMELFCGGFTRQYGKNGGKCGLCGDPWDAPHPRNNEAGGIYANGIVVRNYTRGQILVAEVDLTAHHKGYFEFRVCPAVDELDVEVTQECLDETLLFLADGSATRYYLPDGSGNGVFKVPLLLPAHLTCERCVFQWIYSAGNNWGACENGTHSVGCGNQEQFRGCADIGIYHEDQFPTERNDLQPEPTVTERSKKKKNKKKKDKRHKKKKKQNRNKKNKRSTTLPPPTSGQPLLRGSGVILTGSDLIPHWESETSTTTTKTAVPSTKPRRQLVECISAGAFANRTGITQWCMDNCLHTPPFCPPSHCQCHYITREGHAHPVP